MIVAGGQSPKATNENHDQVATIFVHFEVLVGL